MNFHFIVLAVLALLLVGAMVRIVIGPTIWDRLLGFSLVSAKIVMGIIIFASFLQRTFLLDIAIVYSLLGFIGSVLIARYLEQRRRT
jgi:multicomponent Na+:H+ antiporter subunit F